MSVPDEIDLADPANAGLADLKARFEGRPPPSARSTPPPTSRAPAPGGEPEHMTLDPTNPRDAVLLAQKANYAAGLKEKPGDVAVRVEAEVRAAQRMAMLSQDDSVSPDDTVEIPTYPIERYALPEAAGVQWDPAGARGAATLAQSVGMPPAELGHWATEIARRLNGPEVSAEQNAREAATCQAELRQAWGATTSAKLAGITRMLRGAGLLEDVDASGLGVDPTFLRRMGELYDRYAARERARGLFKRHGRATV